MILACLFFILVLCMKVIKLFLPKEMVAVPKIETIHYQAIRIVRRYIKFGHKGRNIGTEWPYTLVGSVNDIYV